MFFSITPAPIFRGPPIQARSADATKSQTSTVTITKPVTKVLKRRMSRCLTLSSVEVDSRPCGDAYALSRERNRDLEEKFKSVLQVDPGRLLETGEYADFTVICGDREWKTHKAVLARCDYFKTAITMGFKETYESKITIEDCSEIEIDCLLRYIYTKDANIDKLRASTPSRSYLEACARLWFLGDYFALPALRDDAYERFAQRCQRYHTESSRALATIIAHGSGGDSDSNGGSGARRAPLPFLPDLEAAVHAAWDPQRALAPLRAYLVTLCCLLHPFLGLHPSFAELLGDAPPAFAADFARALLGFPPAAGDARAPVAFAAETGRRQLGGCAGCGRIITLTRTSVDGDDGDEEEEEEGGGEGDAGSREVVKHGGMVVGGQKLADVRDEVGLVYHAPMSVGLFASPGRLLCGVCAKNDL